MEAEAEGPEAALFPAASTSLLLAHEQGPLAVGQGSLAVMQEHLEMGQGPLEGGQGPPAVGICNSGPSQKAVSFHGRSYL